MLDESGQMLVPFSELLGENGEGGDSQFELGEGVRIYIFNDDMSVINGAYTGRNNKPWGRLAVSHLPGEEIPEDYWVYRLLKKQLFFGMGGYG